MAKRRKSRGKRRRSSGGKRRKSAGKRRRSSGGRKRRRSRTMSVGGVKVTASIGKKRRR